MCFAPQRRALFRQLNFQKCSGAGVFCAFWLRNVLRTTTACTFSTSQLPKVLRTRQFFALLIWKCASRHNGVQFSISQLATWLRTHRFSEPTFRHSVSRLYYLCSHLDLLFSETFSFLIFFLLLFSSLRGTQWRHHPEWGYTQCQQHLLRIVYYTPYICIYICMPHTYPNIYIYIYNSIYV